MSEATHSRRQFIRGVGVIGAAGIAATGTAAAENGSGTDADGEPCDPLEETGCSFGSEPDYGVSYLVGRVSDYFPSLGDDDYEDAQEDSIHLQAHMDGVSIKSSNDSVLTTIENLIENAKSVCYQIGRAEFIEQLNEGETIANAEASAISEMEDYISKNQENVAERWNVAVAQIENTYERAEEIDGVNPDSIYQIALQNEDLVDETGDIEDFRDAQIEFVDGTEYDVRYVRKRNGWNDAVDHYATIEDREYGSGSSNRDIVIESVPDSDRGEIRFMRGNRFRSALDDLIDVFDESVNELQSFSEGIADDYQAGDIDTEDLTTPRDLWEMSSDDSDNPNAAADLAGLGLEVDQASQVTIDLLDDELLIDGSVYLSESPIGEKLDVGTVYDPTESVEYDDDDEDEPVDYEGTEDDPVPLDGLTFIAYNTDDGSTYDQIQQPFEVVDATDEDGETIDEVGYEPSGGQQTTTTDVDELRDELESMNDELIRVEEERRQAVGGGGLFGDGIDVDGDVGIIAVVVGLAILLFSGGGS